MGQTLNTCTVCPASCKDRVFAACSSPSREVKQPPRPDFCKVAPLAAVSLPPTAKEHSSETRHAEVPGISLEHASEGMTDSRVATPPVSEARKAEGASEAACGAPEPMSGRRVCRSHRSEGSESARPASGRRAFYRLQEDKDSTKVKAAPEDFRSDPTRPSSERRPSYRSEGAKYSTEIASELRESSSGKRPLYGSEEGTASTKAKASDLIEEYAFSSEASALPKKGKATAVKSPPDSGRRRARSKDSTGSKASGRSTSPGPRALSPPGSARKRSISKSSARAALKAASELSHESSYSARSPLPSTRDESCDGLKKRAVETEPPPDFHLKSPRSSSKSAPHDKAAVLQDSSFLPRRTACKDGTKCTRKHDTSHLAEQAHPFDADYSNICTASNVIQEQPSLRGLFQWVDVDGSGKVSLKELEAALPLLERLFGEPLCLSGPAWERLDEDGNGRVNFSEFAAWAGPRLGLPLGVQHLFTVCSIMGCPCEKFAVRTKRQRWKRCVAKQPLCKCGHKHSSHDDVAPKGIEVAYPSYWSMEKGEFSQLVPLGASMLQVLQKLLDSTYRSIWTRDRKKHNPDAINIPKAYQVTRAWRSESSKYWQEYSVRRAEISRSRSEEGGFREYTDVKSVRAWEEAAGSSAGRLRSECNEWYLFHGTTPEAAEKICAGDFKMSLAGSSTGTLYGKGCYFAESVTKADEYAKANSGGERALLLCRALGGRVFYTADMEPDPEELTEMCIEGSYDCILGDREKCKNTFREFVFYDTENLYAEYVIYYKRIF